MALTKISTDGVKDDAITAAKLTDTNAIDNTNQLQSNVVTTSKILDASVTLAKLEHGTSSNDGKFLRANNGADPSFETVTSTNIISNADNRVITGSGTANTLNGESNLTFDGTALGVTGYADVRTGSSIDTNVTGGSASGTLHKNTTSGEFAVVSGGTGGNNHLTFYTSASAAPTEKLRILAGGGLTFNGDTATANALDDYEEGNWTPVWSDASSGGTAATVNQAHGRYTKIGRVVHLHFYTWSIQNQGTSNSIFLQGLPFASIGSFSFIGSVGGRYFNQGDDNQYNLQVRVNGGNSYGNLEWAESHSGDAVAATFGGIVSAYTNFTCTLTYLTDS